MRKRLIISLILCVLMLASMNSFTSVHANDIKFDDTNVLDDLKTSTVNGKPFDIKDYPFNSSGKASVINFVEYCYTFRANMQGNFGLYLYVYNPQALNISTTSRQNKVQLAVAYNADGTPKDYEKFELQFCSVSTESSYYRLFYKFKIKDRVSASDGKTILKRVNSNERRYDISGIELHEVGKTTAREYHVGGTYKFNGYAAGYGADQSADSNLTSDVLELETVSLSLNHLNYRTGASSLGVHHYNDVQTIYFSVPNELLEKYGRLQKIKAEWWEYKTMPIVITKNDWAYNKAKPYIGMNTGGKVSSEVENIGVSFLLNFNSAISSKPMDIKYDWAWNWAWMDWFFGYELIKSPDLPFLFYSADDYVTREQMTDYIYEYPHSTYGYLDAKDGNVSADLFLDIVDNGRTRGYNVMDIDADDKFDILSYMDTHNGWQNFWAELFYGNVGEGYSDIQPIQKLTATDIIGTESTISTKLLIKQNDVQKIKDSYTTVTAKGESLFLFRFAVTDYFVDKLTIYDHSKAYNLFDVPFINNQAYVAQQTVFLDFDIIQLTFNRDGIYHVIPVVASPIDIINDITPPPDYEDNWWQLLLMLVFAIVALMILAPILPYVIGFIIKLVIWLVKAVVWIITLPFKAIKRGRE